MDWVHLNDTPRIATSTAFSNTAGAATDPSTVSLIVRDPAGTETTYTYAGGTVSKASTGSYYKDLQLTQAGLWSYRWIGTGAVEAVDEDVIYVARSSIA